MISFINPIFMAMDVLPIMPENWAGLCAVKRAADPYISRAESDGYSNHICSYARIGMGYCSMLRSGDVPSDAPDGGMAKPTMIIGSSFGCDSRHKWFESIGRYMDVPIYNFDVMQAVSDVAFREDVRDQYITYQVEQYRGLVSFMENVTGHRMDWDKLSQYVDTAIEMWKVMYDAYEFQKAIPCPMGVEDAMNLLVPSMMMEGDQEALDLFKDLYVELKDRVENGIGVIPDEKYRLIWGAGIAPWHTMKIFNHFQDMGAVFVYGGTYSAPHIGEVPRVSDPLERLAIRDYQWSLEIHKRSIVGGYNFTIPNVVEAVEPYHADGVVQHVLRSCRRNTIGRICYMDQVRRYTGVPILFLESDMCDVRDYSEGEWQTKAKAFLETVDNHKCAKVQGSGPTDA
jgi:benzoyl-CoA reductase/2-hydroxyglutaryl-CoA dehydratase subunit BcrC/BadD/HgdB